jgi:predicted phage tail protein
MPANQSDQRKIDTMKEVVRLLHLAIDECEKAVAEAEQHVRKSEQDNRPK